MPPSANFLTLQAQINTALKERFNRPPLNLEGGYVLVEGFITQSLQSQIGGNVGIVIGGPLIPIVAAVGNSSGQIYYFPLKVLLPNLNV